MTALFRIIPISGLCLVATLWLAGSATPALSQPLIPLRVQMGEVDATKIPLLLAMDHGTFKKHGLAVDLFFNAAKKEMALRRGVFVPPHLYQHDQGDTAPIIQLGGFGIAKISSDATYKPSRVIIATLDPLIHWKIIGSSDIKRPEDLKGKRLGDGAPGDENHVIARVLCERMGWDPRFDLSLLHASPDLVTLRSGIVDAVIATEMTEIAALGAGLGYHTIVETAPWRVPIPGSGINVTPAFLRDNRDTLLRFMKSLVEGIAIMKRDRNAAYRALAKWYNIYNPEHQKIIYDGTADMEPKPYPSVEGIKMLMKLYDSHEMRKHKAEEFYDDSIMRELDESGFIDSLYK